MACPNLTRLSPPYHYNHNFTRLSHALSTRSHLQQHVWLIAENAQVTERSHVQLAPGLMTPEQAYMFVDMNSNWSELTHLALHSVPGGILEHQVFVQIFKRLPMLAHLSISHFDIDDFHDDTMLALPSLESLRLENLPGVTGRGLVRWAGNPNPSSLKTLRLFDLPIQDLSTLGSVLYRLKELKDLAVVQNHPINHDEELVFHPLLSSASLQRLTWDLRPGTPAAFLLPPEPPTYDDQRKSVHISRQSFSQPGSPRPPNTPPVLLPSPMSPTSPTNDSSQSYFTLPITRASHPNPLSPPPAPHAPFSPSITHYPYPNPPLAPLPTSNPFLPALSPSKPLSNDSTTLLALSLHHSGFPFLTHLTAASDPRGHLQSTCVPRFHFAARGDKYHGDTRLPPEVYVQTLHAARRVAERRAVGARDGNWERSGGVGGGVVVCVEDTEPWIDEVDEHESGEGTVRRTWVGRRSAMVVARGGWVGTWPGDQRGCVYRVGERKRLGEELGLDGGKGSPGECSGMWNAGHKKGPRWWRHEDRGREWDGGVDEIWA